MSNVIYSKKPYVSILRNHGILDRWYQDIDRKENVFDLLQSLSSDLSMEDIMFIKKYILKSEENDKKFIRCFWRGITEEREEMFELRMLLYEHYPDLAQELFIDVKSVVEQCEMLRMGEIACFWKKYWKKAVASNNNQ